MHKIQKLTSRINVKKYRLFIDFLTAPPTYTLKCSPAHLQIQNVKRIQFHCGNTAEGHLFIIQSKFILQRKILGVRTGESILGVISLCVYFQHEV